MNYFEALLYGIVQGITEYLPISSSAHLILLPRFLGIHDPGLTFDVFLHFGTLLSTLCFFWRDWGRILYAAIGKGTAEARRLLGAIILATVPALLAGALLHRWVESVLRGNAVMIATLSIGGLALFGVDRICTKERTIGALRLKDAFWIGIAQCFALIPGISRSGSTITGARLLGFDRETAARFSFLISAPVTAAALVFELRNWPELAANFSQAGNSAGLGPIFAAGIASFLSGLFTIGLLIKIVKRFTYLGFAIYRVALAAIIWAVLGV